VPALIALALPPGPAFVDALRQVWEAGDAALPLDGRLPRPALDALLDRLAPAAVLDEHGERHRRAGGGIAVREGDALVVATSGTTGAPKGVVLTHDAVAASAAATSARLAIDPGRDRWLCCLPVAHVGGLAVITRALVTKTPLEVHPAFDAGAVAEAARRGATRVSLVATALARLQRAGGAGRFRSIVLGGAAPPEHLPENVVVTYGMTETGRGVVYDGEPLAGVEVRIADGRIQVRGPMLLRAYRDGDHESDPKDADGWLDTGDGGELDAGGGLVVHGRVGDLIVTGGENVWPAPVEALLACHPGVAEVLVTGRPDPEWGQAVTAVIVPADPAGPPSLAELRDHVRAELPAFCAPRRLDLVKSLPKTASGKIKRNAL
jgi:O-succinylbenzoic acid--CoA ligase